MARIVLAATYQCQHPAEAGDHLQKDPEIARLAGDAELEDRLRIRIAAQGSSF